MRTTLDALVTEKALHLVNRGMNADLVDLIGEDKIPHNVGLKNVCAKVAPELSDEIDNIVNLLGISKRRFLEAAFIEAVEKAKAIIEAEGVWQVLEEEGTASKAEAA